MARRLDAAENGWSRPSGLHLGISSRWASAHEVHMTIPHRGTTGDGTYFITASTFEKQCLLQSERMARLLLDVLFHYQNQGKYQLHEFVVMPNHFPLLITPQALVTLEWAMQFVKGGFSFRAKKELGFVLDIWQ